MFFLPGLIAIANPVTIEDPAQKGIHYLLEPAVDGKLPLTVNECFFPALGLTAIGEGNKPDAASLNGGKSFKAITGWNKGESAEWGLYFQKPGGITLKLTMSGGEMESFSLRMGDIEKALAADGSCQFDIDKPGIHPLRLTCIGDVPANTTVTVIDASGAHAVCRKRWRPAAAHAKFSSSQNPKAVQLWIMEMDAAPGALDFYAPMTTPFGYYGPSWKADGTVNSGFNFSLWSYGRGQEEPPVEELSHLLAIGNRDAEFGGFGHEGTGVKIRKWEPLKGRQGQSQALALRVEPGPKYNTFYSYFYAADEKQWRLFGVGRKKSNRGKPLESLTAGSFVEVPGPPQRQRSGAYERRMRYRGWVMDADGKLSPIDQMTNGNVDMKTGLTHTHRGVNEEGWFFLQTGGWAFRTPPAEKVILAPGFFPKDVPYLGVDDLKVLRSMPSSIEIGEIAHKGNDTQIRFTIRNLGNNPQAFIYSGENEGLTFAERWEFDDVIPNPVEGSNTYTLPNTEGKALRFRLFLRNDQGQFWSMKTID